LAKKEKKEITDWIMCSLSLIPLMSKPNEHSIMISQMLYGESAIILQRKTKIWAKVLTSFDNVEAWVDLRQITYISQKFYEQIQEDFAIALEICDVLNNGDIHFPVMIGSTLPKYDGLMFKMKEDKYVYKGQVNFFNQLLTSEQFEKIARRFVNAPYIYGGRSIFGIDSTALVQLVFKCAGIVLPRNMKNIMELEREQVDFTELSKPGDIAFLADKNGELNHIGLILSNNQILHVDSKVVINVLDHEGVYNKESRRYAYKLLSIKRFL
jgi:gamma-D-glutamyl-L-lysine dipeptidyl-peptidase